MNIKYIIPLLGLYLFLYDYDEHNEIGLYVIYHPKKINFLIFYHLVFAFIVFSTVIIKIFI